ncbi:MAG: GntR family transcriptional regulator, partial [Spirillospora sp.]
MDLHVSLVGRRDLAGQIYRQLRAAILDGRLRPGEALPPTRELARRLEISRNTVGVAYDRLGAEGFLTSRVGAGTFVLEGGSAARGAPSASPLRPREVWE